MSSLHFNKGTVVLTMNLENCFQKVVSFFLLECITSRTLAAVTLPCVFMGSSLYVM